MECPEMNNMKILLIQKFPVSSSSVISNKAAHGDPESVRNLMRRVGIINFH